MLDVKVKIDLTKPAGKLSFGYPFIFDTGEKKIEYTECTSLADVKTAGFEETTNVYKKAALMFSQSNPPAKIAVGQAMDANETAYINEVIDKPWRQFVVNEKDALKEVITLVSATAGKMVFIGTTANGDPYNSDRIVVFYHTTDANAVAALVGEAAGREVGSFTYKNLILNGIEPCVITEAIYEALFGNKSISFVTKAGDNVTTEGTTTSGEYIDIIDCQDYIIQQLEYQTQKTLNNMGKIPYDNNGIAILESVAVNVMRDAYNKGIIATNEDGTPAYSVNYAKREDVDAGDRAERKYLGGQFSFTLAGAIHTVEVTGEILI